MLPIIISAPHSQVTIDDKALRKRIALTDYQIWKCSDPHTHKLNLLTCSKFKHVAQIHRLVCDLIRKADIKLAFHDFDFF